MCDNITLFSPFPPYSDNLRSLRSLRHRSSASASAPAPFPIPSSPSPISMTRVSYHGHFLIFPDLYLVFPLDCVIPRSLLDSLRWYRPASALRAPLNSSSLPPPCHRVRIAPTSPPLCRFHLHIAPASTSLHLHYAMPPTSPLSTSPPPAVQ